MVLVSSMAWVVSHWSCVSCGQIEMVHARAHVLQQKYERIGHILSSRHECGGNPKWWHIESASWHPPSWQVILCHNCNDAPRSNGDFIHCCPMKRSRLPPSCQSEWDDVRNIHQFNHTKWWSIDNVRKTMMLADE